MHAHSKLIDAIGGAGKIAKRLGIASSHIVSNWRQRGVPWRYRPALVLLAGEVGAPLPRGFTPTPSPRPADQSTPAAASQKRTAA